MQTTFKEQMDEIKSVIDLYDLALQSSAPPRSEFYLDGLREKRKRLNDAYSTIAALNLSGNNKKLYPLVITSAPVYLSMFKLIDVSYLKQFMDDINDYSEIPKILTIIDGLREKNGLVIVFPKSVGLLWVYLSNIATVVI